MCVNGARALPRMVLTDCMTVATDVVWLMRGVRLLDDALAAYWLLSGMCRCSTCARRTPL
jgi:hypothetical protein